MIQYIWAYPHEQVFFEMNSFHFSTQYFAGALYITQCVEQVLHMQRLQFKYWIWWLFAAQFPPFVSPFSCLSQLSYKLKGEKNKGKKYLKKSILLPWPKTVLPYHQLPIKSSEDETVCSRGNMCIRHSEKSSLTGGSMGGVPLLLPFSACESKGIALRRGLDIETGMTSHCTNTPHSCSQTKRWQEEGERRAGEVRESLLGSMDNMWAQNTWAPFIAVESMYGYCLLFIHKTLTITGLERSSELLFCGRSARTYSTYSDWDRFTVVSSLSAVITTNVVYVVFSVDFTSAACTDRLHVWTMFLPNIHLLYYWVIQTQLYCYFSLSALILCLARVSLQAGVCIMASLLCAPPNPRCCCGPTEAVQSSRWLTDI